MRRGDFGQYSDAELIKYFRNAALERAKTGFNARKGNRIADEKLTPAYEALASRGKEAVGKLLQLTTDENTRVRLEAAVYAYDTDPAACRAALQGLIRNLRPVGVQALLMLLHKDPEFSEEFDRLAELGEEHLRRELAGRFGGYLED